ncbi:MAG: Bug family tripartite tricarboxylate transporter substrate binding protein [Burkholderiales bacterium]
MTRAARNARTTRTIRRSVAGVALAIMAIASASALAQPTRPVRMIVTVSAGGSIDTIARALAEELTRDLGQSFVVENRPGANGNLAAEAVARAAPDGQTLLITGGSTLNLNPHVYASVPFDPIKSFAPISLTARTNFILVAHPGVGATDFREFVALAKAKPGRLNYGSAGNGSLIHIATELFNGAAGIVTQHVPYKGIGPALNDLVAGQIDFMFDSATSVSHVKAGKLRAYAVVGPNRLAALPELRTLAELGVPGMDAASGWHGLFAPAGTDAAIIHKINGTVVRILQTPSMKARIAALGAEPAWSTSEELARQLANDLDRLGAVVKKTNARAE